MKKITVIGAGLVGSTSTYGLMMLELADEIALVDLDEKRANAEVLDIRHGFWQLSRTNVKKGSYADCKDSQLIVITAGVSRKPGESRRDLMEKNSKIMQSICAEIRKSGTEAVVLVVSNPVDALTNVAAKALKFPEGRVFGTGCALDTSRLVAMMAARLNQPISKVEAVITGEHGDGQVVNWDKLTSYGETIPLTDEEKHEISEAVRLAGMTIIEGKGKTYYGIATTVCAIARSVMLGFERSYSVCVPHLDEETGSSEVRLISKGGIIN